MTRRCFIASLAASSLGYHGAASATGISLVRRPELFLFSRPVEAIIGDVLPKAGVTTGVAFGDSIQKLIAAGVIDLGKRDPERKLPDWVERLLTAPSYDPIVFSQETAPYLVDLLWPLGLANRVAFNEKSPINTVSIPSLASTGGWTLGRAENGYVYFNQVEAVRMTGSQQDMVLEVANNTFRPCCNNSTFFQDCNHGSALLGLLELAGSQGAPLERLYEIALIANSFWFPDQYAKTAVYFSYFRGLAWHEIEPKRVLGFDYSSLSGWQRNVDQHLVRADIQLPGESRRQQAC